MIDCLLTTSWSVTLYGLHFLWSYSSFDVWIIRRTGGWGILWEGGIAAHSSASFSAFYLALFNSGFFRKWLVMVFGRILFVLLSSSSNPSCLKKSWSSVLTFPKSERKKKKKIGSKIVFQILPTIQQFQHFLAISRHFIHVCCDMKVFGMAKLNFWLFVCFFFFLWITVTLWTDCQELLSKMCGWIEF